MSIPYNHANDVRSTLNGAINNSTTSITVTSGTAFPAATFNIRIDDEVMKVTSKGAGTNWTVVRATETVNGSATAASHVDGSTVVNMITGAEIDTFVVAQPGTSTYQSGAIALDNSGGGSTAISGKHTSGSGVYGTATSGTGVLADCTGTGNSYAVKGSQNAPSDSTGAAANFDGGTHANGLQVVNNHATKETVNSTNSGAGSAGIFANNGAQTTVTGTNSGAGDGVDGSSAGGAFFGVKGTNAASSDGAGAGGKFDGGTHTVGAIITTNHATKEALSAIQSGAGPVVAGYSGATLTSQINTDGSANLYVSPNYVMNGDMLVNQRLGPGGTVAIASGTNTTYGLDRWRLDKNGTSAGTFGHVLFTVGQTAVPDEPTYYLDWNHSTAGTGATKDNIEHYIESVRTLAGKQVTLSFYGMVASSTATVACELEQNFGTGGSPSSVVTSTAQNNTFTTTWTKFSYTVTLGSISGKTIGTTANTSALVVRFKCPLNTAVHPSIAHVQLETGPIATPFRVESIGDTLNKCYRYFYKSFPYATAPAQNAGRTGELYLPAFKAGATAQNLNMNPFYIPMRVTPTFTYFNPGATNALAHTYGTGNADCSATSTGFSSERHIVIQVTTPINTVVGDGVGVHLTGGADYGD